MVGNEDYYPTSKNGNVYFVSERSGTEQFFRLVDNGPEKFFSPKESHYITSFDLDSSNNILYSTYKGIYLNDEKILPEGASVKFIDKDTFLYTKKIKDEFNIYSYNIFSQESKPITEKGGYVPYIYNGETYFSKLKVEGIWKITDKGAVLINSSFPAVSSIMQAINYKTGFAVIDELNKKIVYFNALDGRLTTLKENIDITGFTFHDGKFIASQRTPGKSNIFIVQNPE